MSITVEDIDKSREKKERDNKSFFGENEQFNEQFMNDNSLPVQINPQNQNIIEPKQPIVSAKEKEKKKPYSAWDVVNYKTPRPTYDPNRPEELKRLARNNALAKGLSSVGDMIALGQGANVNKRAPDNLEVKYLGDMYNYIDKYNQRLDNYDQREFYNKMRLGQMFQNQKNTDREFAQREKNYAQDQTNKEKAFKFQEEKLIADQKKWEDQLKLNDEKFKQTKAYQELTAEEKERHNRAIELTSLMRAERTGKTSKEPFKIWDKNRKSIELEGGEREKILSLILSDANITKRDLDLLEPSFGEPVSTNTMNLLVQKYWEQSDAAKDYLKDRLSDEDIATSKKPADQTQPKKVTALDLISNF